MTHAIDTVLIDAILGGVLRELGLPETLPLIKLSPRMQEWIVAEAGALQRDAMTHPTVAVLVRNGLPLTRENYLNLNNVDVNDLDAEQKSELPQLFPSNWSCGWKNSERSARRPVPSRVNRESLSSLLLVHRPVSPL